MAHIACEEIAKIHMLIVVITKSIIYDDNEWKSLYTDMRSHKKKIIGFLLTDKYYEYYSIDELINLIDNFEMIDSKEINDLNDYKNNSLYAGFINNKFLKPSELITEERAVKQVEMANKLFDLDKLIFKQLLINLETLNENPEFREHFKDVSENLKDILIKKMLDESNSD